MLRQRPNLAPGGVLSNKQTNTNVILPGSTSGNVSVLTSSSTVICVELVNLGANLTPLKNCLTSTGSILLVVGKMMEEMVRQSPRAAATPIFYKLP